MKVRIVVRGGIVSEVYSDEKELDIDVLDMDVEDDPEEMDRLEAEYDKLNMDKKMFLVW